MALGVGHGDEVCIPSFTFVATANAVKAVGATPIFVDIEPINYTISPFDLQKKITEKTKAIIPVHLYGHAVGMNTILNIAKHFDVPIIEDACQSLGTIYNNKHTGTMGKLGCYSFYPGKVITTGEGGMVVTNSVTLYKQLLMIRNHGMIKGYDSKILGLNLRMTEINAAIGVVQMKRLPVFIKRRRENALYLSHLLNELINKSEYEIIYPIESKHEARNNALYTITVQVEKRSGIIKALNDAGYGAAVYYPIPVHKLPLYKDETIVLPFTDDATKVVISVPIHPNITKHDLNKIAKVIGEEYDK